MKVYELKKELNFKGRTKIFDFQNNKCISTSRDFLYGKSSVHDMDKVVFYRFVPLINVHGQIVFNSAFLEVFVIQPFFDRNNWRWLNCD